MLCKICETVFYPTRTWSTFFIQPLERLCHRCEHMYPIGPVHEVIQFPETTIFHLSLIAGVQTTNSSHFEHEMEQLFRFVIKNADQSDLILWFDNLPDYILFYLEAFKNERIHIISCFP